jgi:biotin transport system ATP-binding protein
LSGAVLESKELSFGFTRLEPLLDRISLSFRSGELCVVAGRNGAGKTIFAKCLAGILAPTGGQVLFEGSPLSGLLGSPAIHVAYVYQDARLQILGDTVLDDCLFGLLAIGEGREASLPRARRALAMVNMEGMETRLAFHLSGGEQRRLAIAGILALDPSVIILDEPFANLDYASVRAVLRVIIDLRSQGRTLVVLTHELEKIVGLADRLAILDGGRLVADGKPGESLESGIESFGLRDPRRLSSSIGGLSWAD